MGKPFANELAFLPRTYDWAIRFPIEPLTLAVTRSQFPLVAIGSGGSFTAAHLAVFLHQERFSLPAVAATPLELSSTDLDLREAAILFLTAGGNNSDILGAFDVSVRREPRHLTVVCASKGSKLAARANKYSTPHLCEFSLPSGRDGFLATNSLLASCVVLHRAYIASRAGSLPMPKTLAALAGPGFCRTDYSRLLSTETLLVLYPPSLKPVAVDIESKFTEAALGHIQFSDYRQFAHGRHHWLAKRGNDTAILALATEGTSGIMEKTLRLIPKHISSLQSVLPHEGSLACLAGLVHGYELVQQAGKARGIDPGDPKVPMFGRKLYHLKVFDRPAAHNITSLATPEIAIARKTKSSKQLSKGQPIGWVKAHHEFLDRLRRARIRAIVFDYDGTLCDEERRFDPLPKAVADELKRLLRAGIILGIATGRGKSIRERLQESLPRTVWGRVVVGYYNGGDIGLLNDDSKPNGIPEVSDPLSGVAELLKKHSDFLGVAEIELRLRQITLRPLGTLTLARLWQNIEGLLRTSSFPGVTVLKSGHSIDILAPKVSKLAVLDRVTSITGASRDNILCIGDQGCWPGNDHELLGTPLSLSVDVTSADPERCWNLAPVGLRESQATITYLKHLRTSSRGVRFDLSEARGGSS